MRAVCRHTLLEVIPIIMKIRWESLSDQLLLTMSKLNVVTEKFSSGSPSTSTWVALITKVSFLSLYVY